MKKVFLLIGAAVTMSFMACTGSSTPQEAPENDSTEVAATEEPEEEAEPEALKGPATFENDAFTMEIPEGWQVTKQGSSSCTVEPVEKPEEGSNFGWELAVTVWESTVFKAEEAIKDREELFEESKRQPDQKLGDFTYLYTFYPYEFGNNAVLAAPLSEEGGYIEAKIGGYKLEDTPAIQDMLKSLKLK